MRVRLLREEGGFALPEVLVTMMLMITVMFALYSAFDMSIRVFSKLLSHTVAVLRGRQQGLPPLRFSELLLAA